MNKLHKENIVIINKKARDNFVNKIKISKYNLQNAQK